MPEILILLCYVVIGALAGVIGGLLGLGGGVITVPCLFLFFTLQDFPPGVVMHMAIATSLAAMILNTISATWAHAKRGGVVWKIVKQMLFGLIVGSLLGVFIASSLSEKALKLFFGIFLCVLGVYFFLKKSRISSHAKSPSSLLLSFCSVGVGAISNLLGIGGGAMTVPLLMACNVEEKKAIGTSAATSLFLTTVGAI